MNAAGGKNGDDLPMPPLTRLRTREEDSSEEEESDAESLPASPVRRASGRLAQQPAPKAPAPKRARTAGKKKGVEASSPAPATTPRVLGAFLSGVARE